jgi:hypothetical protein
MDGAPLHIAARPASESTHGRPELPLVRVERLDANRVVLVHTQGAGTA